MSECLYNDCTRQRAHEVPAKSGGCRCNTVLYRRAKRKMEEEGRGDGAPCASTRVGVAAGRSTAAREVFAFRLCRQPRLSPPSPFYFYRVPTDAPMPARASVESV